MLIDAHCHLDFADFDDDRDAMFARAQKAGVGHFVVPGTTRECWQKVLALGERPEVDICLGLHPYFIGEHRTGGEDSDLQALEALLDEHPEVVAVGECGIDARFRESLDAQWTLFDAQLRIAKKRELPVVIHCVHANDGVAKRLRQLELPKGGLIHAFSGSPEQAERFLDLGYWLGLGGATTYDRAKRLHRAVQAIPDDGYVLETDSPDMPLSGYRGQRNEPARVVLVAEHLAGLRNQSKEEIAEHSTANVRRLFGLDV
ncbi:TatD family hydrolase [Pistricoccus aurantiacus]|uniref:TatD family hydrolase n=1 Tax=Pistricoccus aurantiacus TaxID=1883414 RepID=UPI0036335EFA